MRRAVAFFALASATAFPTVALSDTCAECRAIGHFRTCETPGLAKKPFFKGAVIGLEKTQCSQRLVINVPREVRELPPRIRVDLGGCFVWAGNLNDVIDVAVGEPLPQDGNVYSLGCGIRWGKH